MTISYFGRSTFQLTLEIRGSEKMKNVAFLTDEVHSLKKYVVPWKEYLHCLLTCSTANRREIENEINIPFSRSLACARACVVFVTLVPGKPHSWLISRLVGEKSISFYSVGNACIQHAIRAVFSHRLLTCNAVQYAVEFDFDLFFDTVARSRATEGSWGKRTIGADTERACHNGAFRSCLFFCSFVRND